MPLRKRMVAGVTNLSVISAARYIPDSELLEKLVPEIADDADDDVGSAAEAPAPAFS